MTLFLCLLTLCASETPDPDSVSTDSTRIAERLETIAYSADSLIFNPRTGDLILIGSSTLDYRDMTLESDTVEYSAENEIITARGESELLEQGESITGNGMIYSIPTRKGRILNAASEYDFGFYTGASITRVARNEFNIVDARFTTCDDDSIHYYFYCPVMKVFPDDKAVARPVYLYVEDTPILYFPYWVFPIRR